MTTHRIQIVTALVASCAMPWLHGCESSHPEVEEAATEPRPMSDARAMRESPEAMEPRSPSSAESEPPSQPPMAAEPMPMESPSKQQPEREETPRAQAETPPQEMASETPPAREDDAMQANAPSPSAEEDWSDCEYRHTFRAHGASTPGDESSYQVPADSEQLMRYFTAPPWPDGVQLLRSRAKINPRVVHHWAFYAGENRSAQDGQVLDANNLVDYLRTANELLVVVGGPGASPLEMPPDVGLRLPTGEGRGYIFETHYFNFASGSVEPDDSGIEICATSKPRTHEAAVHYIGRVTFQLPAHQRTEVTSTCVPTDLSEPVHILAISPHMHDWGTHAKVVLTRASGEKLTLLDESFARKEQRAYRMPPDGSGPDLVVERGDSLQTTCTFDNTTDGLIMSGPNGEQEMCVMVLWAWPAGVLHNEFSLGRQFGLTEDTDCLEP